MSERNPPSNLLQRLRSVPILAVLADAELAALTALMTQRRANAGETLVAEGEVGDEMLILLQGQVRLTKRTLDDESYTVALHDEGETPIFGEQALLDSDRRAATIEATRACELLVLTRERFERFGDEHPRAGLLLMRQLGRRVSDHLRRANEDTVLLFQALVNEVRSRTAV
jgi:CRP/FNR family cyclic AMP-dependent transcriptional regulator